MTAVELVREKVGICVSLNDCARGWARADDNQSTKGIKKITFNRLTSIKS